MWVGNREDSQGRGGGEYLDQGVGCGQTIWCRTCVNLTSTSNSHRDVKLSRHYSMTIWCPWSVHVYTLTLVHKQAPTEHILRVQWGRPLPLSISPQNAFCACSDQVPGDSTCHSSISLINAFCACSDQIFRGDQWGRCTDQGPVRTPTAALPSAHRTHSAHAVTKYQGDQWGRPLQLLRQPTETHSARVVTK